MDEKTYIGRTKTVLVSEEGPAVITSIIVEATDKQIGGRIQFSGGVIFSEPIKNHICKTIIPQVDEIASLLISKKLSYDLSAINLGAFSSSEIELRIKGYSADLSIFIAALSAALQIPMEQNIVFTGHIASKEGDISQIKQLDVKSQTAADDVNLKVLIYPNLKSDKSLHTLKPIEYENSLAALRSCRGKIKLVEVNNTDELIKHSISEEAFVLTALHNGFFEKEIKLADNNKGGITKHFTQGNLERFWRVLELNLFNKNVTKSHSLINCFVVYYLSEKKYPRKFGEELMQLVLSLPYSVQKSTGLFPLIKKHQYISLIQFAKEYDHDDITKLHNALYGKIRTHQIHTENRKGSKNANDDTTDKLDYILEQINPDYIDLNILSPIDKARASYMLENTITPSYEEFLDVLNSFYMHILRLTNNHTHEINEERVSIEANKIFEETFPQKVQQKEAISIALNGNNGGLRYIFDKITEYLKRELKAKHVLGIINDAVNPLDFEQKLKLISEIMKREDGRLDEEIRNLNPQQFVEYYKEIIIEYANSKQSLNKIFRIY